MKCSSGVCVSLDRLSAASQDGVQGVSWQQAVGINLAQPDISASPQTSPSPEISSFPALLGQSSHSPSTLWWHARACPWHRPLDTACTWGGWRGEEDHGAERTLHPCPSPARGGWCASALLTWPQTRRCQRDMSVFLWLITRRCIHQLCFHKNETASKCKI